ncbi:glycoside hydrolase family 5 protein [Sphingopyxis sp. QXT-31]|uniref:glycoside hydrolase family 5 protein n=1 Tax=Sphingopyxis sp. QXT-31 TaxID=1357916 RepID=UPI0012EB3FF5|nr:glycoside hydrolase family 5 protein [Sphingopyxis sp. QXT-31]
MKRAILLAAVVASMAVPVRSIAAPRGLPVGTCINMGNSLEPPTETAWGGHRIADDDFANIASAGFTTIRLPVRWDSHAGKEAPYTIEPVFLARVKHLVGAAQAAGLNVILDSHNFESMHSDPLGSAPRFAGIWKQIAVAFADQPIKTLWFELENEPHDKFTNANLIEALSPALAAVRATNPDRPVIIGGEFWSGIDSLATLTLPDDRNVYPTFHYYEPFEFTHQGADWVEPVPPLGRTYGSADDAARLVRDVQKIRDYTARTGLLPFMGETGAHTTAPLDQRVKYHAAVTKAFAPLGIGMCTWAYTNTFPFYDSDKKQWLPAMRGAIGLPDTTTAPAPAAVPAAVAGERQPTPELQALDDALPGHLINDPSALDWATFGAIMKAKNVRSADIPGGGAAVQFALQSLGTAPYDAGANVPIRTALRSKGDYVAAFWARTIKSDAPDGKGRIGVRFQQNVAPYAGFGDTALTIGSEWQLYEVAAQADRDIAKGQAVLGLQLAGARQTIEIGQVIVVEGAKTIRQAAAPAAPAADPELPPQLVGKGDLLNDPANREWLLYGTAQTAKATTTNVYGRVATLLTVGTASANAYDAGASVPLQGAIAEGDRLRIAVLARTVSAATPDGQGKLAIRVQQNSAPYDGFADNILIVGPNWRLYQIGTTATRALAAGQGQLALHTAGAEQALEIGPVYVLREGTPSVELGK